MRTSPARTPSARASSSWTVTASRGRQISAVRHEHRAAAAVDPDQVAAGDGQDVAKQVSHQVHAHALEEADPDEAESQRAVCEDAEQRVGGQSTLLLEQKQEQGQARHT